MDVCVAEHFNQTLALDQDVCPNTDFLVEAATEETFHALSCYGMDLFNKSDYTSVLIMNTTELIKHLGSHKEGMCSIVLFFASWCPFSIKMALFYNAFGRLYPGIPTLAVRVESQVYGFAAHQHR